MTIQQMTSFFGDQAASAEIGFQEALKSSNVHLASLTLSEQSKCLLMKGLLIWRSGEGDPTGCILRGIKCLRDGIMVIRQQFGENTDCTFIRWERAEIMASLIGLDGMKFDIESLHADRLLDALLSIAITGEWDAHLWSQGLKELKGHRGAELAVQSYELYHALLTKPHDTDVLLQKACCLFELRQKDSWFKGGDQTEGGGLDNALVIDYRLAAIIKYLGVSNDNYVHVWRWG